MGRSAYVVGVFGSAMLHSEPSDSPAGVLGLNDKSVGVIGSSAEVIGVLGNTDKGLGVVGTANFGEAFRRIR